MLDAVHVSRNRFCNLYVVRMMKFQGLKKCCNFFNDNIDNDDDDDNNNDDDNILSIFFYLRVRWSKFEFAIAHV